MYPQPLFYIFHFGITLYGLIMIGSFAPAALLGLRLARERGIHPARLLDGVLPGILAGYIADRLSQTLNLLFHTGVLLTPGIVSVPAALIIMTTIFFFLAPHRPASTDERAAHALRMMDMIMAPLALAHGLSRFACLANGCCHGKPAWGLPWAIVYTHPASASLYQGIPVHPTPIYDAIGNFIIVLILLWLRKKPFFQGRLLWVYLATYGLLRFGVEFTRGDLRAALGPLTLNQIFCLVWIALGSLMLSRPRRPSIT